MALVERTRTSLSGNDRQRPALLSPHLPTGKEFLLSNTQDTSVSSSSTTTKMVMRAAIVVFLVLKLSSKGAAEDGVPDYLECWMKGDPHVTTFDGAHINVFDPCKYLMVKHRDPTCHFRVELKTERRLQTLYPTRSYTRLLDLICSQRVRLVVGGLVFVDGNAVSLPYNAGDLAISRNGRWTNVTLSACKLHVDFDGDKQAVIRTSRRYMGQVAGLCGNMDYNARNDLVVNSRHVRDFPTRMQGFKALVRPYLVVDDSDVPDNSPICTPDEEAIQMPADDALDETPM